MLFRSFEGSTRVKECGAGQVSIGNFDKSSEVGRALHSADKDGSGSLDIHEIVEIVSNSLQDRKKAKMLQFAMISLALLVVVFACISFGLTWAVFVLLKDSKVQDGVLVDAQNGTVIKVC